MSDVSLGKSSQSIHIHTITSHYQCAWFIIILELECILTYLNGGQFRQVFSVTHITITHSQTQCENTPRMNTDQIQVIWEKACLVITHYEWEYSSTPMMGLYEMRYHPFEWKSTEACLFNHSHHSHSLSNTTWEQVRNASLPKISVLSESMSNLYSYSRRILFSSNDEPDWKFQLFSFNAPISITSIPQLSISITA